MAPKKRVSVIVCTRDRAGFIEPCIRSILGQSSEDFDLLVVDQSASDDTEAALRGIQHPGKGLLAYCRTPTKGLSRARNVGIGMCRGEIVAFTDDDVIADEHWVRHLLEDYERHPGIDIIFGRVLPLEEQSRKGAFCVTMSEEERVYAHDHVVPYGIGGGNNMTFRRSVIDRIGVFDERFGAGGRFPGAEDIDLIFRSFADGFDVLYSPRPVVYHRQWRDWEDLVRATRNYNYASGAFIMKHLLAGNPRMLRVLRYRLWHHALSAVPSGMRRRDWNRIRGGLGALHDHVRGAFALLQD